MTDSQKTDCILRGDALASSGSLDLTSLGNWLWEAACVIRGPLDAPKFKDYILPLIFIKRLSDVFDDELTRLAGEFGSADLARQIAEGDRKTVRFYVPDGARWSDIRTRTTGLGDYLTGAARAIEGENPERLRGILSSVDFNATAAGQQIVDDARLAQLVQVLSRYRLGLEDVEPDLLGRAYEYLLRKFAEGQGQSAGEFYTPREVGVLMARMLDPEPGMSVYDPCCGSGGLLIKCDLRLLETQGEEANGHRELPPEVGHLRLYGQEINSATFNIARMNAVLHEMQATFSPGDTMNAPAYTTDEGGLQTFDLVAANPMWNQDFPPTTYEHDAFDRFRYGVPPNSSADWAWIQHMYASLTGNGRMAVVLDTGAVSRGSGNQGSNKERDIRKAFVEADLVECVILLPENLFMNTTAPGTVTIINKQKRHPDQILLINAGNLFLKGRPKNYLTEDHIAQIHDLYRDWQTEDTVSVIVETTEVVRNDYNLSPSRYVASDDVEPPMPLEEAMVLLAEAEEERVEADQRLWQVLKDLGLDTGRMQS